MKKMLLGHSDSSMTLCEWLNESHPEICASSLMIQAFWFFHAIFSITKNETAYFRSLNMEVSNISPCSECSSEYLAPEIVKMGIRNNENIDMNRAQKAAFVVESLTETELTEFIQSFHLWKAANQDVTIIMSPHFDEHDGKLILQLNSMYPDELALNSKIIPIGDKRFIFSLADYENLTETHRETLRKLSSNQTLVNPVSIEIDEQGRLIVD